ncbi:hypothetical protein [Alicyclobacillus sp. ALC3]|uniref:hypothetical protein n=1 Tax=Alicyclobacillus sp. ALC3 TaxID=2796143 RepID=UPI00237881E9|nr:hypothetical protein [Alicyclobacillus sp. ALC3]WDL99124.1 hypothetical protein JC200_11025 [Alicyclobacillus sp. ALC3]
MLLKRVVAFLLVMEFMLWGYLLYELVVMFFRLRGLLRTGMTLKAAVIESVAVTYESSRVLHFVVGELRIWKFAFFGWGRARAVNAQFTLHKSSTYFGFFIVMLHEQIIEGIALHFWLHSFNPILAWVSTGLHFYSIVWIIGDYNAIRSTGISVSEDRLVINVGLRKRVSIPMRSIQGVQAFDPRTMGTSQDRFIAAVLPLPRFMEAFHEFPQIAIKVKEPVAAESFLGRKQFVTNILIRVDHSSEFLTALQAAL